MGWQEIIALSLVAACAVALWRKLAGKSKKTGACENCLPDSREEKPHK
jgi:hypothetical protein